MTDHDAQAESLSRLDRRAFVTRAGLVAAGALGGTLLEACGPASAPAPAAPAATSSAPAPAGAATQPAAAGATGAPAPGATAASGGKAALPTYLPFEGPKPDLAGNEQGLDPAFFKFPSDLIQSVPTP